METLHQLVGWGLCHVAPAPANTVHLHTSTLSLGYLSWPKEGFILTSSLARLWHASAFNIAH